MTRFQNEAFFAHKNKKFEDLMQICKTKIKTFLIPIFDGLMSFDISSMSFRRF